jgi:hypothetical protein
MLELEPPKVLLAVRTGVPLPHMASLKGKFFL